MALSYLKVPLLVRYTWPTGAVQPYLQAGLTLRTLLSMSHNTTTNSIIGRARRMRRATLLSMSHNTTTNGYNYPASTNMGPLLVERQRLAPGGWLGAGLQLGQPERRQPQLGVQGEVAGGPTLASPVQNGDDSTRFLSVSVLLGYDLTR